MKNAGRGAGALMAFLLFVQAVTCSSVSASEMRFLGATDNWFAFQYDTDCWLSSAPTIFKPDAASSLLGDSDFEMLIALKYGSHFPIFQIVLDTKFDRKMKADAMTDGQKYDLIFEDEALWLESEDELPVIKKMLAGNDIIISVKAMGLGEVEVTYKANELQAAYNDLARKCKG